MKTKDLIIELICDVYDKRYFIVREIVPNSAPVTVFITDSSSDLTSFFDDIEMK